MALMRLSCLPAVVLLALCATGVHAVSARVGTAVTLQAHLQHEHRRHTHSLEEKSRHITMTSALDVLRTKDAATLVQEALQGSATLVKMSQSQLRAGGNKKQTPATGLAGVDKAKEMLNEMIEEVQSKYDLELQKCCDYDHTQSSLMEECRQDISNFNAEAAEARQEILEAEDHIQMFEYMLPELGDALSTHNRQCHEDKTNLEAQLKIIMADISVMDTILTMTTCATTLLLLKCQDECTGKSFVTFHHKELQGAMAKLQSSAAKELLDDNLNEAYESTSDQNPAWNATTWAPQVVPEMSIERTSPCKSAVPKDKRTGKCSINNSPDCEKIQERFKYIQAGIEDKRDELQAQLSKLEGDCERVKLNIEAQVSDFEQKLKDQQTALAGATKKQNDAEGQSRLKGNELTQFKTGYAEMTKTCHTNYNTLEGEECGLKKIRGELYKMQGQNNPAFFQDCVVSEWLPGECSATCGGGVLMMTRTITTHPVGGATCPPLAAQKPCNEQKCPIDCKLHDWSGFSSCSAQCGGGVMERVRDIEVEAMHGGDPCGETSETMACNVQSCDKDCELHDWSAWSDCSKECDAGVSERARTVAEQPIGQGTCPDIRSEDRHQENSCNNFPCVKSVGAPNLKCESKVDIILLLDGSGSLGQAGWEATVKAGAMLARAFGAGDAASGADVRLAVLLFSYSMNWVQHFGPAGDTAAAAIEALTFPRSLTFTSKALDNARSELSLGRGDAESVVVVITDGRPMYNRRTTEAAKALRREARLMWIPVTRWAPVDQMREWASEPHSQNLLSLPSFEALEDPANMDLVIADVCPHVG